MPYRHLYAAIRHPGLATVFTVVLLFGCASGGSSTASSEDGAVSVAYGEVMRLKRMESQSGYGAGVLIGGALGLGVTSGAGTTTQLAGAAGGSASGGAAQRKMKSASYVSKYTVRLIDGQNLEIVTDNQDIHAGDCVAVERGENVNIRIVSPWKCKGGR